MLLNMSLYIGIQSNRGQAFENDADALAHAFTLCGITPVKDWSGVDAHFESMLLEWFYSGNWIRYHKEDVMENNNKIPCFGCASRNAICHTLCEEYREWSGMNTQNRIVRQKQKQAEEAVIEHAVRRALAVKKRRKK